MPKIPYPISPEECLKLEGLEQLPQWPTLVAWLSSQEVDLINHLKSSSEETVEKAALTASAVSGALKQLGRIKTLPLVVNAVLERYRKEGLDKS